MRDAVRDLPTARDAHLEHLVNVNFDFLGRVDPALIACPVVFAICTVLIWPSAYRLHKDYAWAIYRTIHGDTSIKIRFIAYEVGYDSFLVFSLLSLHLEDTWPSGHAAADKGKRN